MPLDCGPSVGDSPLVDAFLGAEQLRPRRTSRSRGGRPGSLGLLATACLFEVLACGPEDPPSQAAVSAPAPAPLPTPTPASTPAPKPTPKPKLQPTTLPHGTWYEVALPADATPVGFPAGAGIPEGTTDMFLIDPVGRAALSMFHPMPGHDDREEWTAFIQQMFVDAPTRTWEGEIDDVPATVSRFDQELRWTLVVDGFGVLVKCLSEKPRDEAWFRERCEPIVASVRLARPLTATVRPPGD
jgi:hypothetical protein